MDVGEENAETVTAGQDKHKYIFFQLKLHLNQRLIRSVKLQNEGEVTLWI